MNTIQEIAPGSNPVVNSVLKESTSNYNSIQFSYPPSLSGPDPIPGPSNLPSSHSTAPQTQALIVAEAHLLPSPSHSPTTVNETKNCVLSQP